MKKIYLIAIALVLMAASGPAFAKLPARTLNVPENGAILAGDEDEEKPEVTARVARISFIRGEVKVRRAGEEEWEKAVLNLPLIEGDEIATGTDGRVEVQFNNYVHARLDRDAYIKFAGMKEEGVALSISQGTLRLRVTDFEKAGGYLEVDAPKTTLAVEKAGAYRIDAGGKDSNVVTVAVTNGGSARLYSENAGFTVKSGRTARFFVDGINAGEFENGDAAGISDEFDDWSAERDSVIAKRLADAYYDKYYDQDIYAADDLNGYGDWVYTSTYGYVWRPSQAAISPYADWSPYRYGQWRWLGAYGWTWVNDEPWGWATYHHGRWVWDSGRWVWCPYGYYRTKRSWWFPALVSITIVNNNVCWWPLGYRHRWRNYNGHHGGAWAGNNGGNGHPRGGIRDGIVTGSRDGIPKGGIMTVKRDIFGARTGPARRAPDDLVAEVIKADITSERPLPTRPSRTADTDIYASRPRIERPADVRVGAAVRKEGNSLDQELKQRVIYGERRPAYRPADDGSTGKGTGAVERPARRPETPAYPARPRETVPDQNTRPAERPRRPETTVRPDPPSIPDQKPRERPRPTEGSRPIERRPVEREPARREPPPPREQPRQPSEKPKEAPREQQKPGVVDRKTESKDGR